MVHIPGKVVLFLPNVLSLDSHFILKERSNPTLFPLNILLFRVESCVAFHIYQVALDILLISPLLGTCHDLAKGQFYDYIVCSGANSGR